MQVLKTTHPLPLPTASHDENSRGLQGSVNVRRDGPVKERCSRIPYLRRPASGRRHKQQQMHLVQNHRHLQRRSEGTKSPIEEAVFLQAAQIGGRGTMLRSRDDRSFCFAPVWIRGTLLPVGADGLQHSRVQDEDRTHA